MSPPSSWNLVCFVHSVTTTNQRSPAALVVCGLSGSLMKFTFDDSAVLAEFCTCSSVDGGGGVCKNVSEYLLITDAAEGSNMVQTNGVRVYGSVQPLA